MIAFCHLCGETWNDLVTATELKCHINSFSFYFVNLNKKNMSSEIRMYSGPLNNRIDRVESVGNTFRISGVPNHIKKENIY